MPVTVQALLAPVPPCLPSYRSMFQALLSHPAANVPISSLGCTMVSDPENAAWGFVPCTPERLRADAERQLRERGFWPYAESLSLDVYSLARNMSSEQGGTNVEQLLAMGLSTLGHGVRSGRSAHEVVLYSSVYGALPWRGAPPDGRYGCINCDTGRTKIKVNPNTGESKAVPVYENVHGRWTASSKNPTVLTLLLAKFLLAGGAGRPGDPDNFAHGADDQAGSSIYPPGSVLKAAQGHRYWVGNIPGVNPRALMLFKTLPNVAATSAEGQARIKAANLMVASAPPNWSTLPLCPTGGVEGSRFLARGGTVVAATMGFTVIMGVVTWFLTRPAPTLVARARSRAWG